MELIIHVGLFLFGLWAIAIAAVIVLKLASLIFWIVFGSLCKLMTPINARRN